MRLVFLLRIYARKFPVTSAAAAIYFSAEGKGAQRDRQSAKGTTSRGW